MKILLIELSNLGDAILTLPALSALWEAFPKAEFHLLVGPRAEGLFSGDPRIHKLWRWEKRAPFLKQLSLIGRLFFLRFDLVVDFRHSLTPLFLFPRRRTPVIRWSARKAPPLHRAEQHLALVTALGIPQPNGSFGLWYGQEEERQVDSWVRSSMGPRVVLAPGSRSHLKRWAAEGFAFVADRLITEHKAQVFLVGDEEDRPVTQAVLRGMRQSAVDLTGQTTIPQLACLFEKSALVITNDSACLHAAEAMGTPTVAIFGPTDSRKYGPRNPRSVVIRRSLICAPCEQALCPYQHQCMNWIQAHEVYEAALKILQGVPQWSVPVF